MSDRLVCENCGKDLGERFSRQGRPKKYCPECRHARRQEQDRESQHRRKLLRGWLSRRAQQAAEVRMAESALHHYRGSKDKATFAWPRVFQGQPVVVEIRGQMTYAPAQLLGRLK